MDTKRLKHRHRSKGVRSKMDNRDAEVFVLPPDILQKLGIHLGGIDSVQNSDMAMVPQTGVIFDGTGQSSSDQKMELRKGDETILETASLMKKSVLLSPTFISTVSSIPGEVEISGIIEESNQPCNNYQSDHSGIKIMGIPENVQMNTESSIQKETACISEILSIENKNQNIETPYLKYSENIREVNKLHDDSKHINDIVNILEQENIENNLAKSDLNNFELVVVPAKQEEFVFNNSKHIGLDKINDPHPSEDHLDEAYSSDCSNSNLGPVENLDISFKILNDSSKAETLFKKINIISEEIIEPSKLIDFKILKSPNRMALTPVTIKSILTRNKTNDTMEPVKDGNFLIKNTSIKAESTYDCINISAQVADTRNDKQNFYDSRFINSDDLNTPKENYDLNQNSTEMSVINQTKATSNYECGFQICNAELQNMIPTGNKGSIHNSVSNVNHVCSPMVYHTEGNIQNKNNDVLVDDYCKYGAEQGIIINEKEITSENNAMSVITYQYCNDNAEMKEVNKAATILQNGEIERSDCVHQIVNVTNSVGAEINENLTIATSDNIAYTRNKIIKSNIPMDKVEEIGSLLRKFVRRFKRDKAVRPEIVNDKRFPVKPDMTNKTKLCIQGVEKPGGIQKRKEHKIAPKVLKTYQRRNRQTQHCFDTSVIVNSKNEVSSKDLEIVTENLNILTITDTSEMQEYCLCCDFGRLDYYDCDSLYEHIHFWEQKLTGSNPDIIYSIYNDNDCCKYYENRSLDEYIDVINTEEIGSINICWKGDNGALVKNIDLVSKDLCRPQSSQICLVTNHSFIKEDIDVSFVKEKYKLQVLDDSTKDNYIDKTDFVKLNSVDFTNQHTSQELKVKYDLETFPAANIEEAQLANEISKIDYVPVLQQPSYSDTKTYKPKHSKQNKTIDWFEVKEESEHMKTEQESTSPERHDSGPIFNECGICNHIILEPEWEDHISKHHCFVAWKSGYSFDLDNTELLLKLNQRLMYVGVLTCTFCDRQMKNVNSFISHIKNCMYSKGFQCDHPTSSIRISHVSESQSFITNNYKTAGAVITPVAIEKRLMDSRKNKRDSSETCFKEIEATVETPRRTRSMNNKNISTGSLSSSPDQNAKNLSFDNALDSAVVATKKRKNTELEHLTKKTRVENTISEADGKSLMDEKRQDTDINVIIDQPEEVCQVVTITDKTINDDLASKVVCNKNEEVENISKIISGHTYNIPRNKSKKSRDKNSNASKVSTILVEEPQIDKNNKKTYKLTRKQKNKHVDVDTEAISRVEDKKIVTVSTRAHMNNSTDRNPKPELSKESESEVFNKTTWNTDDDMDVILSFKDKTMPKLVSTYSRKDQNTDDTLLPVNKLNVKVEHDSKSIIDELDKEPILTVGNQNINLTSELASRGSVKCSIMNKNSDPNSSSMTDESTYIQKDKYKNIDVASKAITEEGHNILAETSVSTPKTLKSAVSKLTPRDKNKISKKHKNIDVDKISTQRNRNKTTPGVDLETQKDNKSLPSKNKKNKNTDLESPSKLNDINKNGNSDSPQKRGKHKKTDLDASVIPNVKNKYTGPASTSTDNINSDEGLSSSSSQSESSVTTDKSMTCGVCKEVLLASDWINHIAKNHNYLAWEDGLPKLQFNREEVNQHLNKISKENGGLICSECGFTRKYVKTYLQHIKSCGIVLPIDENVNDSVDDKISETSTSVLSFKEEPSGVIKCGVCHEVTEAVDWISHIQKKHNYMAWIDGETPLDMDDAEQVQKHLLGICRENGGLTCVKCGLVRKYVKLYLQHIKTCEEINDEECVIEGDSQSAKIKKVQCAVCSESMSRDEWKPHAMSKHYNIAWIVGRTPIDLRNGYAVEKYLKEYHKNRGKMVCKICKISRVSYSGFYAHILTCGKTDEETEMFKDTCEICNSKYLCVYKSPHMAVHREQANARERKLKLAEKKENPEHIVNVEVTPGRRKAAEKAKSVIEKYKSNMNDSKHTCSKCGFGADREEELSQHECSAMYAGYSSDSDVSVKMEQCSDDDSADSDVDSLASEEEEAADKKRRQNRESKSITNKVVRIPFNVKNTSSYLQESYDEFRKTHLTNETLFSEWHDTEYEPVPDDEVVKYLPPLKRSCKVKFNDNGWTEHDRFEATEMSGYHIMFAGASVQCISWAPVPLDDNAGNCGHFLAVATHSGVDQPRIHWHETRFHAGLLQIWDAGDFKKKLPKIVLGLAHNYGTVWAMDWCPSGARDLIPVNQEDMEATKKYRLGLLAVVCSNGAVYIFSIPYPSTITEKEKLFYKLKPKVELRLSSHADREKCQATSVCWSTQKGHGIIIVGYSDGTSAFYDLTNESPLLKTMEHGVTILSPFHDERSQNSSVTGVGMYPCGDGVVGGGSGDARWCGAWCSASASGARMSSGAGAAGSRGASVHSYMAAGGATFTPLWPSVLLAGDDCVVSQSINELEWFGGGRRLGAVRVWCRGGGGGVGGGGGRSRLLASAPPLLRVMRAHPLLTEISKEIVGTLQMAPIAKKRKRKQSNDELAMKLEPLAYDDAVAQYGIELKLFSPKDNAAQQKALSLPAVHYPERYPLADVSSMAFCSCDKYDRKLALATHAGVIFLIDV